MTPVDPLLYDLFLLFCGAAILATFVLFTRQSLLVAYMLLGIILGPACLNWIHDVNLIATIGNSGIIFLLFLLGLHLEETKLVRLFHKTIWVTLISSLSFGLLGFLVSILFGLTTIESLIVGSSMMFSSTIIGLKLLPTTILHHQHTGELMISILLLQDLLAIAVLLLIHMGNTGQINFFHILKTVLSLPFLIISAFLIANYGLVKLMRRFNRIQEYLFLLAIAWCLTLALFAKLLGLSEDIGAFIAGISLANHRIALFIADSLKPLRDFFLVMFFFAFGASFDLHMLGQVIIPALVLAISMMLLKPLIIGFLLRSTGESKKISFEIGIRLGQLSEFSVLISSLAATTATGKALIGNLAFNIIQATTILTFIASSYWVVWRYPTPIAMDEKLQRD